jgi:hypothetical protein
LKTETVSENENRLTEELPERIFEDTLMQTFLATRVEADAKTLRAVPRLLRRNLRGLLPQSSPSRFWQMSDLPFSPRGSHCLLDIAFGCCSLQR